MTFRDKKIKLEKIHKKTNKKERSVNAWENCEGDPKKSDDIVVGKTSGVCCDPIAMQVGYSNKSKYDL